MLDEEKETQVDLGHAENCTYFDRRNAIDIVVASDLSS